ncbi:MAG: ScpA family protein [Candidatus Komeilibacteria bacterium]|nr:ScpA family protein [Candidatus Komeilibacteria bacterium]
MTNYQIKLEQFEGPLDLLLSLIEEEEMDITKVSLAKVADQFMEYLHASPDLPAGDMADFLLVASKLLLIKSKILIPTLEIDDEEAGSLEKQLKIYKEYYEAAKVIRAMVLKRRFMFSRAKQLQVFTPKFYPPLGVKLNNLALIFKQALARLEPIVNLPQAMMKRTISIREKIKHISDLILAKFTLSFRQLLGQNNNRTEVIVSFLAILELVKQRTVSVEQGELFSDITVTQLEHHQTHSI